jgi:hypothetical protein
MATNHRLRGGIVVFTAVLVATFLTLPDEELFAAYTLAKISQDYMRHRMHQPTV